MTRLSILLSVSLALPACAPRLTQRTVDPIPRIAVISAIAPEITALKAAATITRTEVINGRTHYIGRLAGRDVVMFLSGISMVNAAMTTQAMLDRFTISRIVFSGIAGGVNPDLRIGDVTVPARWASFQENVFAREVGGGWDPGLFAGQLPNFGMMFPRGTHVTVAGQPDSVRREFWFPVDSTMLAVARGMGSNLTLRRCATSDNCLSHEPRLVVGGAGVSGPTFVDNAAYREWTWKSFQADALDMETAAVAIVAHENRVPYIAFRSLSDLAGGGPGRNESRVFGQVASDNAAAVVLAFLAALPR
jgi:adenosylhomocysteine nucleosidase